MTRILLIATIAAFTVSPALAFDPQPEPPKTLAGDGSVKPSLGSIKMGDGSVRIGIQR